MPGPVLVNRSGDAALFGDTATLHHSSMPPSQMPEAAFNRELCHGGLLLRLASKLRVEGLVGIGKEQGC